MTILERLNPQQREAVTYLGGPLLILAGAGSGKTGVLTNRIAYLLEQGVSPFNILAITFTNKAAGEMKERVGRLVGPAGNSLWVSTFHSACVRILRREIEKLGNDRHFGILDTDDQKTIIKDCLKELNISDKQFHPSAILAAISRAKNELLGPEPFSRRAKDFFEQRVSETYVLYQRKLRQTNALDFDDLIMRTVELLQSRPDVLEHYQEKFRHVLVDEYQDTNHAQYVLIRLLAGKYRNLCVVGDEDQSIYLFRGANIRNILDFEKDFPEARVVKLEQNYRSTQNILSGAHAIIRKNRERRDKRLWTDKGSGHPIGLYQATNEHDEAWFVSNEIERLMAAEGRSYRDFAVLYRTNAQSRVFEEIFRRQAIPYCIVGGLRFYERKEVKDLLAYLRLIANPSDILSFRRIVNVPRRGIGPTTVERIERYVSEEGIPISETALQADQIAGLQGAAAAKVKRFGELMAVLRQQADFLPVKDLIGEVFERTGYLAELKAEGTDEALGRIENLKELLSEASDYQKATEDTTLEGFLEKVALVADIDNLEGGRDSVVFMTLHSAKGLEFPVVFLAGMEEGVFPHSRSLTEEKELEEERRLCYVGMTRAMERLYLIHAWERTLYGNTVHNCPSRFLNDVPEELTTAPGGPRSSSRQVTEAFRAPVQGRPVSAAQAPTRSVGSATARAIGVAEARPMGAAPSRSRGATAARSAAAAAAPAGPVGPKPGATDLKAGDRVRHPKWGEGTVVSSRGEGPDAVITIAIPGQGIKQVVAGYAGLQRV